MHQRARQSANCFLWTMGQVGYAERFSLVTIPTIVAVQTFFKHSSHSACDGALYSQTAKSLSVLLIAAIPEPWFRKYLGHGGSETTAENHMNSRLQEFLAGHWGRHT